MSDLKRRLFEAFVDDERSSNPVEIEMKKTLW
jgi:hypothetical protein